MHFTRYWSISFGRCMQEVTVQPLSTLFLRVAEQASNLRSERAGAVAVVMLFSDVLCHCPLHHTIVSSAPATVHGQGSTQKMNYWCVPAASGGGHSVRPEGLRRLALCMESGYIFKHIPQPPSGRTWAPTTSGTSSRLSFVVPLFPHHRSYHLNNCFTSSPRSHLFVTNTLLGTPANSLSAVSKPCRMLPQRKGVLWVALAACVCLMAPNGSNAAALQPRPVFLIPASFLPHPKGCTAANPLHLRQVRTR